MAEAECQTIGFMRDVPLLYLVKTFVDSFLPFFVASQLQVTITTVGAGPLAGQSYTFICAVTFPMEEFNGTLQWVVPESANPIDSIDGITVSRTTPYNLTINELHQSQDGKYTCQATDGSNIGSTSTILWVGGRLYGNACVPIPSMQWVPTLLSPVTIPLQLFL